MRVIPPLTITDGRLTSSTAAEPGTGEVAWNPATSYTVGQTVYLASNHTRYENLIAGVNATSPHLDDGTRWLELGPTNRWAMFDLLRNTGTTAASPLVVVITPGQRVDSVGLAGIIADSVTIEVSSASGGGVVYDETYPLGTRRTTSWYEYFFGPFTYKKALGVFDLPPYSDGVITLTFERASGDVTVGGVTVGTSIYVGDTQYSAQRQALNFSKVERDEFGNATLIQRRSVPKTTQTLWCAKERVSIVQDLIETLNAIPAFWSGIDDSTDAYFEPLQIFGYYRDLSIGLDHPDVAVVNLELEEV